MLDVVLLVSTSAIFVFGYFLMNKLDAFLENNWNEQETALTYGENSRRSRRYFRDLRKAASGCLYPYFQRRRK